MSTAPLWPFLFEVNLIQRKARRERTVFATLERHGASQWTDHTGRFTRLGGFGEILFRPGEPPVHSRGGFELTPEAAEAEEREFTVPAQIPEAEFEPIRRLIERVGQEWPQGWEAEESEELHTLLERVYWKQVNRFMLNPFDEADG